MKEVKQIRGNRKRRENHERIWRKNLLSVKEEKKRNKIWRWKRDEGKNKRLVKLIRSKGKRKENHERK